MKPFALFSALLFMSFAASAQFEAGNQINVSTPYPDDMYIAGGAVSIDAPIGGDCILAGGEINVNDSIANDLMVGGGQINVRGPVGDDIRVAGGDIEIDSEVMDDLIVFGGKITLTPNAIIHGNVVSYGGELTVNGTVLGAMKASGGKITVNGTVQGPASLSAGELTILDGAKFFSEVDYWSEKGEVDFGNSVQAGEAIYNTSLAWEGSDPTDTGTLLGLGFLFMVIFVLGGYLFLVLLEWAFGNGFSRAAGEAAKSWSRSLGVGVIYTIGVPILVVLSFMIVIGIPVGIVGLVLYLISMIFGNFVAALLLAHLWKDKKSKTWNVLLTALVALPIAIILQLLASIPVLGFLFSFVVLCITFGAIIMAIRARNARNPQGAAPISASAQA
jgi:hypothetical protein